MKITTSVLLQLRENVQKVAVGGRIFKRLELGGLIFNSSIRLLGIVQERQLFFILDNTGLTVVMNLTL